MSKVAKITSLREPQVQFEVQLACNILQEKADVTRARPYTIKAHALQLSEGYLRRWDALTMSALQSEVTVAKAMTPRPGESGFQFRDWGSVVLFSFILKTQVMV